MTNPPTMCITSKAEPSAGFHVIEVVGSHLDMGRPVGRDDEAAPHGGEVLFVAARRLWAMRSLGREAESGNVGGDLDRPVKVVKGRHRIPDR